MNKTVLIILLFSFFSGAGFAQSEEYSTLIKKAESLFEAKDYKGAATAYSDAFRSIGWKGYETDRYNAACAWAKAEIPDSAFYQLFRIAEKTKYKNIEHLTSDSDLDKLHNDKRWNELLAFVRKNKEEAEAHLNKAWAAFLDTVFNDDQQYRQQLDPVEKKYGQGSDEMKNLINKMIMYDSINTIKVTEFLDRNGWQGADVVGEQGNSALFLVIQHADTAIQLKYLPMMRTAVKNGKAQPSQLALLEDRVALRQGKKQIYGSQIGVNPKTGEMYVLPLEDPDNVDKRRAEVGLQPLRDYVSNWNIHWDPEQYKKELPRYEQWQKEVEK